MVGASGGGEPSENDLQPGDEIALTNVPYDRAPGGVSGDRRHRGARAPVIPDVAEAAARAFG